MRISELLLAAGLLLTTAPLGAESTVERAIDVGGSTRSYLIHVPAAWDGVRPLPVLFVFHGAGSDAESMVRATGFDAMADASPASAMLVVYPRAPANVRRYEVDPPLGRASADVLLFDALLERLRTRFVVDPLRVWATGFSNGAALCYRLAAERPDVVAAVAPVAGYLPDLARADGSPPVPLLHVHGTADGRVGGAALEVPTSAVRAWARWNGAVRGPAEERLVDPGGLVLRRQAFTGSSARSDAELLLVEGQGHVWPGGPGGAVSRAVLAFLAAHPRSTAPPPAATGRPRGPTDARAFGSLDTLRWLTPDGRPLPLAAQRLVLYRWFTNDCPHCRVSVPVLASLEQRYRARGLVLVAVYHPKGVRLDDAQARAYLRTLGFTGTVAVDDRWTKLEEIRERFGLRGATSISVLVDAGGMVQWVHPGPRIEPGSADLARLESTLDALLPPAGPSPRAPTR